jgi:hypothetical protein
VKHQPNPEEPDRCLASDLLVTDCSGCRGSDESFVDALLSSESEPPGRKAEVELPLGFTEPDADGRYVDDRPEDPSAPHYRNPKPVKWWLDTGPSVNVLPDSRAFQSSYGGSPCRGRCRGQIRSGQIIVHLNIGGYAHAGCVGPE